MSAARFLLVLAGLLLGLGACAGSRSTGARAVAQRDDAVVVIECPVADAELWVDDRYVGQVGRLGGGIALGAGEHRIELRHDRYHTHYQAITVASRERRTVVVQLAEILP